MYADVAPRRASSLKLRRTNRGFMTGYPTLTRVVAVAVAIFMVAPLFAPAAIGANEQRVRELQGELNKINDEFKRAGAAYDEAYWALDETEKAIEDTSERIASNEAELAEAREVLGGRISSWYRADSLGIIEFLLEAKSFGDLVMRFEFANRVAQADASAIGRVEELLTELREDREQLEAVQAERSGKVEAFQAEKDTLQQRLRDKREEYDKLQRQIAEEARKAEAARQAELAAAAPTKPAAPAPVKPATRQPAAAPGPNGMVFPVAGPNYYSDTWGASRDGGRRAHKGTDIMAATGTPVVATMSGTLSSSNGASSGLYLRLTADNGWSFHYMHLDTISVGSGRVSAGQVIGTVGYTGNASASAPHLHFEIHPARQGAVNPYPYLLQMQGR